MLDAPGGNAAGWNPDGGTTFFTITEPALGGIDNVFITIETRTQFDTNFLCNVVDHISTTFDIACSVAPAIGVELHYVVENLPAHII